MSLFSLAHASFYEATCTFLPNNDGFYVEKSGSLLRTAAYTCDLNWIDAPLQEDFAFSALASQRCSDEASMRHRRLGHVGFEMLSRMCSFGMLTGSNLKPAKLLQAQSELCETYILTKQLAKPHTTPSDNVSIIPLGRMSSNITGNTTDGYHAALLDECTERAAASPVFYKCRRSFGLCLRNWCHA